MKALDQLPIYSYNYIGQNENPKDNWIVKYQLSDMKNWEIYITSVYLLIETFGLIGLYW